MFENYMKVRRRTVHTYFFVALTVFKMPFAEVQRGHVECRQEGGGSGTGTRIWLGMGVPALLR